ncbi:MAG: glycosyltransferase [Chloroflexia bacterium]|nr:glycosyltransferase [Chloroflexia bacterium]
MNKLKLSIITINLNNARGLEKTIKSVVNQTYSNVEYIVVDGGSIDNSVNIIKSYEKSIEFWISEKDNGIFHAMNKGIEKATGDYLLFLNSGDCLFSTTVIEKVFGNKQNKDLLYGRQLRIREKVIN